MRKILLHRVPSLILIELLKKPSTSTQLTKQLGAVHCHVYRLLGTYMEKKIVDRTKYKNKFTYELTEDGKYMARLVRDIYFYELKL